MRAENQVLRTTIDAMVEDNSRVAERVAYEGFSASLLLLPAPRSIIVDDLQFTAGDHYLGEIVQVLEELAVKHERALIFTRITPSLRLSLSLARYTNLARRSNPAMIKSLGNLVKDVQTHKELQS
jgi:hypothetical protein